MSDTIDFNAIERYRIKQTISRRELAKRIWPDENVTGKKFKSHYQNLSNYLNGKNSPYPHNCGEIKSWWRRTNGA